MDTSFEPLPLVIGVTGHRDLRETDIPLLKKALDNIFERLEDEDADPHHLPEWLRQLMLGRLDKRTGATPMIVLSALAEGADQLVAQVAIERSHSPRRTGP